MSNQNSDKGISPNQGVSSCNSLTQETRARSARAVRLPAPAFYGLSRRRSRLALAGEIVFTGLPRTIKRVDRAEHPEGNRAEARHILARVRKDASNGSYRHEQDEREPLAACRALDVMPDYGQCPYRGRYNRQTEKQSVAVRGRS